MKRVERLCRSEKIPEGSVVRWLLLRENVKGVKKEGMIMEWKEMEGSEGSEASEGGGGEGGKTVGIKVWRKKRLKEIKRKRGKEEMRERIDH